MDETTDICPACGGYGKGQRACSCSREFDAMLAKGRKAWAGVPDANQWVEQQRGEPSDDVPIGKAITRLRHIEWRIGEYLHEGHARELTASIDALVWALRQQGVLK